jgi:hypothetical protein
MPITWHNLVGASPSEAMRPLAAAGDLITGGFDRFAKILTDQQAVNQGTVDRGRDASVLAFKEALANAKTPEEIAQIQAQRDSMLAGVDPTRRLTTVGAEDARLASLRTNTTAEQKFANEQLTQAHQATIQKVKAKAALGDMQGALADAANLPDTLPIKGDLVAAIQAGHQSVEGWKTAQAKEQAQTGLAKAQAEAIPKTSKYQEDQIALERMRNQIALLGQTGGVGGGAGGAGGHAGAAGAVPGNPDGTQSALVTGLATIFKDDPGKAQVMGRLVSEAMTHKDPAIAAKLRELPVDVLLRTVQAHASDMGTGKYNPFDWGAASRIQQALLTEAGNPSVKAEMLRNESQRLRASERSQEAAGLRQNLLQQLFPGSFQGGAAATAPAPVAAAAAGVAQPAAAPVAAPPVVDAPPAKTDPVMEKRVELEKVKMALGKLDDHSPEVKKYIQEQDAAAVADAGNAAVSGGARLGAAFNDIITMPVRAAGGIANNVIRLTNAAGANLPYIPDNGWLSSPSPYSDRLNSQGSKMDMQVIEKRLEKELAEAKKAR